MFFKNLTNSSSVIIPKGLRGGGEIINSGAGGTVTITASNSTYEGIENDTIQLALGEKLTIPADADFTGAKIETDASSTASVRFFGIFGTRPKQGPRCQ